MKRSEKRKSSRKYYSIQRKKEDKLFYKKTQTQDNYSFYHYHLLFSDKVEQPKETKVSFIERTSMFLDNLLVLPPEETDGFRVIIEGGRSKEEKRYSQPTDTQNTQG